MSYPFKEIEQKWQSRWDERAEFRTENDYSRPKMFLLIEFPYPSSQGLHVGHPRSYTALDVVARKRRMEGYNVLYPIGFDAFGLPAENYALKTGIHPRLTTEQNIANFRRQLKALGLSFDWEREVATCTPDYYRWTQWMFIRMFQRGLAYKAEVPINWCTSCKVALANEEVVNGSCERCGSPTIRRNKSQWMMRITEYADRLIEGLDTVNFIEPVRLQQTNWIGRSTGATIHFPIAGSDESLEVFTTRPDTIFGATYMVVAPEHGLIERYRDRIANFDDVIAYRDAAARKSDLERTELVKEKTGVPLTGLSCLNPATGQEIPIWVADYVLISYGSGAIMAVPGHDQRDWEFARTFDLPIVEVIAGGDISKEAYTDNVNGVLVNSGILDGLKVPEAKETIIAWLAERSLGDATVNYKLRDWVFSRQRYWGEPIPLIHCEDCGWVPVPDDELPVVLPEVKDFRPSEEGESPLAHAHEWLEVPCPKCGKPGRRETDTMPQWAGSCWYYLRYIDPHNDQAFAGPEALKYWLPVDWYNGGMEHTTLHLLYSRFWHKVLFDQGLVPTDEPYARRTSHGMILGEDGEKMSKSRGNVVNPDDVIASLGADTFRIYEMYLGAFDQATPWSKEGIAGTFRFLNRVWALQEKLDPASPLTEADQRLIHRTIKEVDERIERMKFNTAVAAMMEYLNELSGRERLNPAFLETFCLLLYPFAPHVTNEIWERMGKEESLTYEPWPKWDAELAKDVLITIPVQVNGKLRDSLEVAEEIEEAELVRLALSREKVRAHLAAEKPRRVIYVRGKLLNIVG